MTENNQLEKQEIKRPWQGITWIILQSTNIIGGFFGLMIGMLVLMQKLNDNIVLDLFNKLLVPTFFLWIFLISLTVGFIKGWKWSVISSIIVYGMLCIFALLKAVENPVYIQASLMSGLMVYLSVVCLKHPFYNQKKIDQKS